MSLEIRTAIVAGLTTLLTACGDPSTKSLVNADTSPARITRDGGETSYSCAVPQQSLVQAVEIVPSHIAVHDGDTVAYQGKTYRFSAIDAAEISNGLWPDQYGTGEFSEVNYSQLGKQFVEEAFRKAQSVKYLRGRNDPHQRILGYFIVDGNVLQCQLVLAHLAYETVSHYGLGTYPELAQIVLEAANRAGEPPFLRPDLYKQLYQP